MAEYMPPEVQSIIGLVDCYLRYQDENGDPRGFERYHPSAFGKCLRLMQYQRYSERGYIPTPADPHEPFLCRIFGNGHSMHDRWRQYFEDLGVLKGYWTCTNPLCASFDDEGNYDGKSTIQDVLSDPKSWMKRRRKHGKGILQGSFKPERCVCGWEKFKYDEIDVAAPELNFMGHADMILDFSTPKFDPDKYAKYRSKLYSFDVDLLPKGPIVIDMKSINHYDFQEVAKGNPHDYYLVQLMIYANVLQCDYGVLIYENKNNQRTTSFRVDQSADVQWPEVVRQATIMNDMVEVEMPDGSVDHLLPPPRPLSIDSKDCSYCVYKEMCIESGVWEDPELNSKRLEFYGKLLNVNGH